MAKFENLPRDITPRVMGPWSLFCHYIFLSLETKCGILIKSGFNDMSTIVGHFVSSREREKRDRRDSRGDERGTGKKEEQE